jgi:hypothetical protein
MQIANDVTELIGRTPLAFEPGLPWCRGDHRCKAGVLQPGA